MAVADGAEAGTGLFAQTSFTIIPSDELSKEREQQLVSCLTDHGAVWVEHPAEKSISTLSDITHIIATHVDFPEYQEALNRSIPVVKPSWASDSLSKGRLATTRQYSPDPSQFFHDVILTCGTLPPSDEPAIIAGVVALGGQYSSPLTKIVTHIVTTDLDHDKCMTAQQKDLSIKMVLPHWFDDCLKLGKKIDERPYELPNPQVLQHHLHDVPRINPSPLVEGAISSRPLDEPDTTLLLSPSKSRKDLNAFRGKSVYLGHDLELNKHLTVTLSSLIKKGGGSVNSVLDTTDIYVGQFRESDEFCIAFSTGKIVANLAWLYNVINRNRWSDPLSKLLHYPTPRYGMSCFKSMRISVSSYAGDARTYIQNLVRESGAEFTKTMKNENTHLITAHKSSEKYEAAQEWGINIINHLWLEESYAKCAIQPLTNPRYTTFPSCTNLGDVVCQTRIDLDRIEHVYVKPKLQSIRQRPSMQSLHERPAKRKLSWLESPIHTSDLPVDYANDDAETDEESGPQTTPAESVQAVNISRGPTPKRTPMADMPQLTNQSLTPSRRTIEKEDQFSTVSRGGRASKAKALDVLHKQADDIALYEKEKKRKGGVVHGGRHARSEQPGKTRSRRDASSEVTREGSELSFGETVPDEKPAKKVKITSSAEHGTPAITHRLILTGDERWLNNPNKESSDKLKLRSLGIALTEKATNVDILVAPKILRTRKFLVAIANAPKVVGTKYLDALLSSDIVPKTTPLVDEAGEKLYNFKLQEALHRATINKRKLFRGWEIYVSDNVTGGFETYQEIITANGGTALAFRGKRRGTLLKKRSADDPHAGEESQNQGGDEELDRTYLVTSDSDADKKLWLQFQALAKDQSLAPKIMKHEWLLLAALRQQIHFDAEWSWV